MNFSDMTFIRKFSLNLYKSLNIPLAKMTFSSDFTNTERGDLYPLTASSERVIESVSPSHYSVSGGLAQRLLCAFFPYATYKMTISALEGSAGFVFAAENAHAEILVEKDFWDTSIAIRHEGGLSQFPLPHDTASDFSLIVTARPGNFDVYTSVNGTVEFAATAEVPSFKTSTRDDFYTRAKVFTRLEGSVTVSAAESYIDCGIGQADVRPIRYENGEIMLEGGRAFISFSARMAASGGFQGILSWLPGTADFRMEGALFFSNGDGAIRGEVASSIIYNRLDKKWYIWHRNASAGHVLAYASFDFDVRFGVNVLDVHPLPLMTAENLDDTLLLGKKGDEDPDFTYDEKRNKWLFALCRIDEETHKYRYFFFESDRPDGGYQFIGKGPEGEETGGSIVRLDGKIFFICGNGYSLKSNYRVYEWGKFDSFTTLKCDYPDGGFRGWGTVMPIRYGSRIRYFWLTFDRTLMSKIYSWSYGNLYCFEAEGVFKA